MSPREKIDGANVGLLEYLGLSFTLQDEAAYLIRINGMKINEMKCIEKMGGNEDRLDTYSDYFKHPPRTIPLVSFEDDRMIVFCSRYPFTGFGANKRSPTLPPITQTQIEALNVLHFVAEKNSITLDNQKGDSLYLNNMSCLHGREALGVLIPEGVEVEEANLSPRHRMRFFLRDPTRPWKLPTGVMKVWEDIHGKNFEHSQDQGLWVLDEEASKNNRWQFNG